MQSWIKTYNTAFIIISYCIESYHIISYHIISNNIISYHIISYHIISYHIISNNIISYHIISYHIMSYHFMSYHIISYHIISQRIVSYRIISHHFTSHLIMSRHVASCHVTLYYVGYNMFIISHSPLGLLSDTNVKFPSDIISSTLLRQNDLKGTKYEQFLPWTSKHFFLQSVFVFTTNVPQYPQAKCIDKKIDISKWMKFA